MASRMGAQGIEIDARSMLRPSELTETGRRQLRRMLDDLNLRVAAVRFMTRRGYDCLDDLDRRMEATREALKFAYSLGANVVINAVGPVDSDPESRGYQLMKSCLDDIAGWGQRLGAMLACETGTEPVDRLVGLLESLQNPTIGVAFNPGNLIVHGFYDADSIVRCGDRVLTVVARDATRDLTRGRGLEVPLGTGSADFPQILGALEQFDYRGWLLADRLNSDDPEQDLANAVKFLQRIQA
ncbi:MAG: sugar phosphate isomerase/epimerase [Planctomycetota bacterium]|nr:MAG: sugar phosphate isomerase/epimerase [Planctomycetota bacterium]